MILRLIIFLIVNIGALGIGGLLMGEGASSNWYAGLQKAPWTPPGWVFGFAWTTIMICFSFYMAYAWPLMENKNMLLTLFIIQWALNVSWNSAFFYHHNSMMGMVIISLLTLLVGFILFFYLPQLKIKSALIVPYFLWLLVATSLNGYILVKN